MNHTQLCFLKVNFHRTQILSNMINKRIKFGDQFVTKFSLSLISHNSQFYVLDVELIPEILGFFLKKQSTT